jgi:hypothetical protein
MRLLLTLLLTLAIAACGHSHDDNGHSHDNGRKGAHGAHDHHGEAHHIGHAELEDGYHIGAARVGELEAGKEGVFEIHVRKDGQDVANATVVAWLTDAEGKDVTRRPQGEFMSDENLYDVHVMLPPEMTAGMILRVRVLHAGKELTASFPLGSE